MTHIAEVIHVFSEDIVCNGPDEVVVGGCASGNYFDCKNGSANHVIKCCQAELETKNCRWQTAGHGHTVRCNSGEVIQGQCASGGRGDCSWNNGGIASKVFSKIKFCTVSR